MECGWQAGGSGGLLWGGQTHTLAISFQVRAIGSGSNDWMIAEGEIDKAVASREKRTIREFDDDHNDVRHQQTRRRLSRPHMWVCCYVLTSIHTFAFTCTVGVLYTLVILSFSERNLYDDMSTCMWRVCVCVFAFVCVLCWPRTTLLSRVTKSNDEDVAIAIY